jgi:preprotein translocase subunit SecE
MSNGNSGTVAYEDVQSPVETGSGRRPPPRRTARGGPDGFFGAYKPDQGKTTRTATLVAAGSLVAWGAYFLYDRLQVYEGDDWWRLLITIGIPLTFAVVLGALAWRYSFAHPKTGDFMIATEGEMKKVSWSTRREIIGSTKVVILFTFAMAIYLFAVDIGFQKLFQWIGVLKATG